MSKTAIITNQTLRGLEGKGKYSLPGEYEVDAEHANDLIARGLAKAKADAEKEAAAAAAGVTVTQTGAPAKASAPAQAKRDNGGKAPAPAGNK